MQKYDSIIFDLDGTLWDSVGSVVKLWNKALISAGIEPTMSYDELSRCMGLRIGQIFDKVIPTSTDEQRHQIQEYCRLHEEEFLGDHGGILYDGVEQTLRQLKESYRLYIVSNCQDSYIQGFFKAHGLEKYFDGYECAGRTGLSKGENIRLVTEREGLKFPVYIGDTALDFMSANEAGVDFILAAYGFGEVENASVKAEKFTDLTEILDCR